MDWFLYARDFRYERVKWTNILNSSSVIAYDCIIFVYMILLFCDFKDAFFVNETV